MKAPLDEGPKTLGGQGRWLLQSDHRFVSRTSAERYCRGPSKKVLPWPIKELRYRTKKLCFCCKKSFDKVGWVPQAVSQVTATVSRGTIAFRYHLSPDGQQRIVRDGTAPSASVKQKNIGTRAESSACLMRAPASHLKNIRTTTS